MSTYISVTDSITPEWLTAVLRQSGILKHGKASAVEREAIGAFNSHLSHLLLQYSADAPPEVPTRLILKQNIQAVWGMEAGAEEVKFYNTVASLQNYLSIIVPCYAAAYDEQSGNSYLLLQDLSETHQPPLTRAQQIDIVEGIPAAKYIEAVVDTLAQLHAYWWDHPLLETHTFDVGFWSRNAERFERYLSSRESVWEKLLTHHRAWFPDDFRELYEQVFTHLSQHWKRYLEPRFREKANLTLIRGDAYFANFLCPKHAGEGTTYLLDWQSPSFDIGGYDIANLCATFWTSQQRHEGQREEKMLRHYHAALQQYGVHNYSWDDVLTDYKTGLIFWLLIPVEDCYSGSSKEYWWPKMQCLVTAFREWYCEELLDMEAC